MKKISFCWIMNCYQIKSKAETVYSVCLVKNRILSILKDSRGTRETLKDLTNGTLKF